MDREQGRRLWEFLRAARGDRYGWVSQLARETGIRRATLYAWFDGKSDPSLDSLAELARVTGTTRSALVAAMDGEPLPSVEERLEELEAVVARLVEERLSVRGTEGSAAPARPLEDGRRRR